MERKEIAEKYKWDLSSVFASDEAWEAELEAVKQLGDISEFKGKLHEKESLAAFFAAEGEFSRRIERLFSYANMRSDEDVRVTKYNAYKAQVMNLYTEFSAKSCYFEPEMMHLPDGKLEVYAVDPDFADYDYILRRLIANKAHVLSEGEERIMALAGDALGDFQTTFMMLDNADLPLEEVTFNGEKQKMTHGLYGMMMSSPNRKEREEGFKTYYKAYRSMLNTIAATYTGNVKKDIFYRTAKKYDSCLDMALKNEDVEPVVYENLISAVHKAFPTMHRYISLRKQILGFEEQHMYDIYVPLVEDAEIKVPYEEAYKIVVEGLAPLGKDYQALLQKAFDERWIDVYENTGKRSGAYSTGTYGTHPFVLLNYTETTDSVFTVAHEMGHSIHTYKSNAAQPYSKSNYTIFLAEIASTVNEVLLLKYLYAKTTDKNLKKYLLNYYIDMFRTTLFRQTQFAEFEQIAHATAESGQPLTRESLCDIYYNLNKQYYGEGIVHDEEISYEWARIPHFYNSFYVYKYATGITSAISIAKRILSEGESAVEDYFKFLSSGNKTNPVEILKTAGVDLTTEKPFVVAMEEFEETVKEFEKLQA